jgi:hypothetical protein
MIYDWRGVRTRRIKAAKLALIACAAIFAITAPVFAFPQFATSIDFYR